MGKTSQWRLSVSMSSHRDYLPDSARRVSKDKPLPRTLSECKKGSPPRVTLPQLALRPFHRQRSWGREVRRPVRLHHPTVLYIYRYTQVRSENQYASSSCFVCTWVQNILGLSLPPASMHACFLLRFGRGVYRHHWSSSRSAKLFGS